MKKIVALMFVVFTLAACKKDGTADEPVTKLTLLCGKTSRKWKVTGYQRSINSPVTTATADILQTLAPSYSDNLMIFYANGVEKLNDGPTGINAGQDYRTETWTFYDSETAINCTMLFGILGNGDAQLNCSILGLTTQRLVLENVFPFGGSTYYNRWTLSPID
jgi:hypothetical protein